MIQSNNLNVADRQRGKGFALLVFFLWPFISVFLAFWNRKKVWAKNILWAFMVFYGLTFVVVDDGRDATKYRERFEEMSASTATVNKFITILFREETQYVDFLQPLISFFVSRFTSDYHILFGVFGFIFGYFYSRNIWFLLDRAQGKITFSQTAIVIVFSFLVGFWQINGFRFWTAVHMFFFGVVPFLAEGNRKRLWVAFISPLLHFSFLLPVICFISFLLIGNKVKYFFWSFLILLLLSTLKVNVFSAVASFVPAVYEKKAEAYTNEDYLADKSEGIAARNWYVNFYDKGIRFARNVIVLSLGLFAFQRLSKVKVALSLLGFGLLFESFCLGLISVGSMARFLWLGDMFIFGAYFLFLNSVHSTKRDHQLSLLLLPSFLLFIVVSLRLASDSVNITTVIANLFIFPFIDLEMAIIDLIK